MTSRPFALISIDDHLSTLKVKSLGIKNAYNLPTNSGSTGQYLKTNGDGTTTWSASNIDTTFTFPDGNGTSGQFLKTNGDGTTTWSTSSNAIYDVQTLANDTHVLDPDDGTVVKLTYAGAKTITLPSIGAYGKVELKIVNATANEETVTINANGTDTINGSSSFAFSGSYSSVIILNDGTSEWFLF
jgi:hypothetical protein